MKNHNQPNIRRSGTQGRNGERGSATVIAILVLGLLAIFVSLALSRTASEALMMGNDTSEGRASYAAQASLESMTRNFNKIFDVSISPSSTDLNNVRNGAVPGFTGYTFVQTIVETALPQQVVISGGPYQGLNATRDEWKLNTIATDKKSGVQVEMTRDFFNNRIPIFQFGIFYDDNMEFHPGPRFAFGGRVHSNASIFVMAGTQLLFDSRVTAAGHIVPEVARNGTPWTNWGENVFIKDGNGVQIQLKHDMGSVRNGPDTTGTDPDMPDGYNNPSWNAVRALFDDNLMASVRKLSLPIRGSSDNDYIEMVRRGKELGSLYNDGTTVVPVTAAVADTTMISKERYANKPGIRISMADSKAKLPGCASGVGTAAILGQCGIRLDGDEFGLGAEPLVGQPRGYWPKAMTTPAYRATRLNGDRFFVPGREVWIKVELVSTNLATGLPQTQDVTEEILSLGVTEQPPRVLQSGLTKFEIGGYDHTPVTGTDARSVIKLQRFLMRGPEVKLTGAGSSPFMSWFDWLGTNQWNLVMTKNIGVATDASVANEREYDAKVNSNILEKKVVPFPIKMFDTREGLYNDNVDPNVTYANGVVPRAGVMSMIDIDAANLKRFLDGEHNGDFPTPTPYTLANAGVTLSSNVVPQSGGWVLFVSDRRGDADFDGEYDMEDIYGNNDGIYQPGENVNHNLTAGGLPKLDIDTTWQECPRYTGAYLDGGVTINSFLGPDEAAAFDHKYYRRGVRMINGTQLPGGTDFVDASNTRGFTVSSENGLYVQGNYNATNVSAYNNPTTPNNYMPFNNNAQVPASLVADAVTILSTAWRDGNSFRYPWNHGNRLASETTVRAAIISGDSMSSTNAVPNQGGGDLRLAGGVHNFKRFLENWGGDYLNYCGSLINLFNARNNNGAFKCCNKVYSPPIRNWIFDTSFLDPTRLPPGTPYFQYIQVTGFQRANY